MMKNTEWGAVAYLSHSEYGRCTKNGNDVTCEEIRINNYYEEDDTNIVLKTRYAAANGADESCSVRGNTGSVTKPYSDTEAGYKASTTGNITGVYDMAGGVHEYMAAYIADTYLNSDFVASTISKYNSKYFDIYKSNSTYKLSSNMIIGDATGEMGPFYIYQDKNGSESIHNNWYADNSSFIDPHFPWFNRGSGYGNGVLAGQFQFSWNKGDLNNFIGFRIILNN